MTVWGIETAAQAQMYLLTYLLTYLLHGLLTVCLRVQRDRVCWWISVKFVMVFV